MRRLQLVIDDTGSVEGVYAFIYCKLSVHNDLLVGLDSNW